MILLPYPNEAVAIEFPGFSQFLEFASVFTNDLSKKHARDSALIQYENISSLEFF